MIKKLIAYFVIVTALLYALRYLHYKGLLMQTQGYYAKYKTCFLEKNNFKVLFLGSSRAEMHYDVPLFDSLTCLRAFNLSLAGATPEVAFAALKAYLVNSQPPRYLLYEVDYHFLKYHSPHIKEFNNYFPFLSNAVLRQNFKRIDGRMDQFYYNPYLSFPYTGFKNLSTSLHGWLHIPNKTDSLYQDGFFKEVLRPQLSYVPVKKYDAFINPSDRQYLDSIILLCQQKNINMALLSSPIFAGGQVDIANKPQIINQLHHIAGIHGISYTDLSSLSFCNQRQLFIDHYHMNYRGAVKFTRVLAQWFNNKMINNSLK